MGGNVHREALMTQTAAFATDTGLGFQHRDLKTRLNQPRRRCQPSRSCTDDQGLAGQESRLALEVLA